jgi:hypothetical protein
LIPPLEVSIEVEKKINEMAYAFVCNKFNTVNPYPFCTIGETLNTKPVVFKMYVLLDKPISDEFIKVVIAEQKELIRYKSLRFKAIVEYYISCPQTGL